MNKYGYDIRPAVFIRKYNLSNKLPFRYTLSFLFSLQIHLRASLVL